MRIGIDISPIVYETGVSWYTKGLVDSLARYHDADFVLFGGSWRRKGKLDEFIRSLPTKNVYGKTFFLPPTFLSLLWNRLHTYPVENLIGKVDVFHSSDWTQPPTRALKITTIHDLVPLRFPEISHPKIVSNHRLRLDWVRKEVETIIAVSSFTKGEIVDLLKIDPDRIEVIPEAPDPGLKPAGDKQIENLKKRFNISGSYLLVVGADPRKNIPAIVAAFAKIKHDLPVKLVIVGRLWEKIPEDPDIISLGHVSREDLASLYSGAKALVYTSLYEGFGLPILEAMSLGCPVVTSNISSMPEVAGEAAVLVDPTNPQAIADGIRKLLSQRYQWVKAGKARSREFSWKDTAYMTFKLYERLARR